MPLSATDSCTQIIDEEIVAYETRDKKVNPENTEELLIDESADRIVEEELEAQGKKETKDIEATQASLSLPVKGYVSQAAKVLPIELFGKDLETFDKTLKFRPRQELSQKKSKK